MSAFRGVVLSVNNGVGYSGTTTVPLGFTQADCASGDYVSVRFFNAGGTQKCSVTAQPVTVGNVLYAGASGQVSTTGTVTVGTSRVTTTSNGAVIEIIADTGAVAIA